MSASMTAVKPVGQAVGMDEVPDPQVPERAFRRTYTAKYKRDILAEYEALHFLRAGRYGINDSEGLLQLFFRAVHEVGPFGDIPDNRRNLARNLLRIVRRGKGELADFIRDDGKAPAVLPGARRLDSGVEGQQVDPVGDIIDDIHESLDRFTPGANEVHLVDEAPERNLGLIVRPGYQRHAFSHGVAGPGDRFLGFLEPPRQLAGPAALLPLADDG